MNGRMNEIKNKSASEEIVWMRRETRMRDPKSESIRRRPIERKTIYGWREGACSFQRHGFGCLLLAYDINAEASGTLN